MIFIEGADNSGKTKLIEKLVNDIKSPTLNVNSNFGCKPSMINQRAMLQLGTTGTIHDRSRVISELVYGPIIRDRVQLRPTTIQAFYNSRPLVIYCRPPLGKILDNGSREQMDGVLENHKEIVLAYDEVMKEMARFGVRVVNYDWKDPHGYQRVLSVVKRELQDLFEKHCSSLQLAGVKLC